MTRPLARPAPHPMPARLAPVGAPAFIAVLPCGCDGGWVSVTDNSRATWYSEGPDLRVACPDCGGYGSVEVRGVANGPLWADYYRERKGWGGWFVARVTDSDRDPITLAWAPTLDDARAWTRVDDWAPHGAEDAALLAALGLTLGGGR